MLANILQDQTNYHYNTEFHLRVTLDNNSYLQESLYYPVSKEFNITDIYHYEIDKTVSLKFVLDKENLHEEILKYFDAYEKDNQNILTLKDKFYNSLSN